MQTTIKKTMGLGSAKVGTGHFVKQRITAFANLILGIACLIIILCSIGKTHEQIIIMIAHPLTSITLIGFVISFCLHMQLGLRVIVEDYIHGQLVRIIALLTTLFFSYTIMLSSIYMIIRINLLVY